MTTPRHGSLDWDDEKDVERAMRSLDDMEATAMVDLSSFADIADTARDPLAPSVSSTATGPVTVPPVITAAQVQPPAQEPNQRVLRRKPTPRTASSGEPRTLRRAPRPAPAPAPVPSQPYDESPLVGNTAASARVGRGRSAASAPLIVTILLLRLLAIAFCALVVLMAIPSLGDRAVMVSLSSAAGTIVPQSLSGILVIPTPFGGAFRGDFALAALLVYLVDWALTNARARLVRGR